MPFLATDIQWSCTQGSEVCAGLVLGLNSVKPGRKPGTYFPPRAGTKVMLAESRAGTNILHGTWKMPDILAFKHLNYISRNMQYLPVKFIQASYFCKKIVFKTGTCCKNLASIFNHYWVLQYLLAECNFLAIIFCYLLVSTFNRLDLISE